VFALGPRKQRGVTVTGCLDRMATISWARLPHISGWGSWAQMFQMGRQ
jgi:hypothetical protein